MNYHILREFADSWALLCMFLLAIGITLFVFRPGGRKNAEEAANIPFRED